jgi:hypothetical protein
LKATLANRAYKHLMRPVSVNARLYREVQERESRIHRLVNANMIGMHIFHAEVLIVDANQSFLKTVGYGREDPIADQ